MGRKYSRMDQVRDCLQNLLLRLSEFKRNN